ncbi:MAG: potassium channel family protein [Rubrobacteraceae bacterium]
MTWLFLSCGILLVLVGLLDVFFAVLNYDGFSFLSSRVYRATWSFVRVITHPLPPKVRHAGLSIGAPLMIPTTMALWMTIEIVGFGFVYYSRMDWLSFTGGATPNFLNMIYLSGITITTLGYGDITPQNTLFGIVAFIQALIGFSIITLFITYILNIYQVLHQWNTMSSTIYHQAGGTADFISLLKPHFPNGEPRGLNSTIGTVHQNLASYYEGVRRYPLVYYFHSRQTSRSVPYVFRVASEMAAALRWGLPKGHSAASEPGLTTLINGIEKIMDGMEERFVSTYSEKQQSDVVPFEAFATALREEPDDDTWLSRFIELEREVRNLAHLEEIPDPEEAYERYKEWLPFTLRTDAFIRDAALDLGYDPHRLSGKDLDKKMS